MNETQDIQKVKPPQATVIETPRIAVSTIVAQPRDCDDCFLFLNSVNRDRPAGQEGVKVDIYRGTKEECRRVESYLRVILDDIAKACDD